MKQRQRRFKRATRDLGPDSLWHSLTWREAIRNESAQFTLETWASFDKEFRDRVYDIIGIRNVIPEWDTGNFVYR